MTSSLDERFGLPIRQVAGTLVQMLEPAELSHLLGQRYPRPLRGRSPRLLFPLALVSDLLAVLARHSVASDTLSALYPLLKGAARLYALLGEPYHSLQPFSRGRLPTLLNLHRRDGGAFGAAGDTGWWGLRLCRAAAQLGAFDLPHQHIAMLLEVSERVSRGNTDAHAALHRELDEVLAAATPRLPVLDPDQVSPTGPLRLTISPESTVRKVLYSPDGTRLAVTGSSGEVVLWDVAGQCIVAQIEAPARRILGMDFSTDSGTLAFTREECTDGIPLYDAASGVELDRRILVDGVHADIHHIQFLPTGELLALRLGEFLLLDPADAQPAHSFRVFARSFNPSYSHRPLAVPDPKGGTLACWLEHSNSDGSDDVRIFDLEAKKRTVTLIGHTDNVTAAMFSPWGRMLATGDFDGMVRLWDTETGRELAAWRAEEGPIGAVAFSPDGRRLATARGQAFLLETGATAIYLWEIPRGECVRTLNVDGYVSTLAFSPDGRWLASDGGCPGVVLWDLLSEADDLRDARQEVLVPPEWYASHIDAEPPPDEMPDVSEEPFSMQSMLLPMHRIAEGTDPALEEGDLEADRGQDEQEEANQRLWEAVASEDADAVREALRSGAVVDHTEIHVDSRDVPAGGDRTPLLFASGEGYTEVVRVLLDAGANVEAMDRHGRSAWTLARLGGHTELARLLEENGCRPAADLFHHAVAAGEHDLVRTLVDEGARTDELAPGIAGESPLIVAAGQGDRAMVELLLDHGASVDRRDHRKRTAWAAARANDHAELAAFLAERGAKEHPGLALFLAVEAGNTSAVQSLLDSGADPTARVAIDDGRHAVLEALALGRGPLDRDEETLGALARLLLQRGADPDATCEDGTPVLITVGDSLPVFRELLRHGAKADTLTPQGHTALMHFARLGGHAAQVALLLAAGAAVNARDVRGWTALHHACSANTADLREVVELLLSHGADPTLATTADRTVLDMARDQATEWDPAREVVALLQDEQQLERLNRLFQDEPDDAEGFALRGRLRLKLEQWDHARDDLERAIQMDPSRSDPRGGDWALLRALAHRGQGNLRPLVALDCFNHAVQSRLLTEMRACALEGLRLDPDLLWLANTLAWNNATWPVESLRDPETAIAHAQMADQRTNGRCWQFAETLAVACAACGRFEEALQAADRARKLAPEDCRGEISRQRDNYRAGLPWQPPEPVESPPIPDLASERSHRSPAHQLLAQGLHPQALEEARRCIEEAVAPTAEQLLDLVDALAGMDRDMEGIEPAERAVALLEEAHGSADPRLVPALVRLAECLRLGGDEEGFAARLEQARAIADASGGEPARNLHELLTEESILALMRGEVSEGLELADRAVEQASATYGAYHPEAARTLRFRGQVLRHFDQPDAARESLQAALKVCETVLGAEHPQVGRCLRSLGELALAHDQDSQALPLLREAERLLAQAQGAEHPSLVKLRLDLARSLLELGQEEEAVVVLSGARDLARDLEDVELRTTPELILGQMFMVLPDRLAEAETLLRGVVELREQALGEEHESTVEAATALAEALERLGWARDAAALTDESE